MTAKPSSTEVNPKQGRISNPWSIVSPVLALTSLGMVFLYLYTYEVRWMRNLDVLRDGLWFAIQCLPVVNFHGGWLALSNARELPTVGNAAASAGIVLSLALGLCVLWGLPVPPAREKPWASSCIANLTTIATASTMYANDDPLGRTPPTLEALANGTYLPSERKHLRCPRDRQNYLYIASNQVWQSGNTNMVAVHCSGGHLGQVTVLFLNGRVALTRTNELAQTLAATSDQSHVQ
jgi:hypothetical protein